MAARSSRSIARNVHQMAARSNRSIEIQQIHREKLCTQDIHRKIQIQRSNNIRISNGRDRAPEIEMHQWRRDPDHRKKLCTRDIHRKIQWRRDPDHRKKAARSRSSQEIVHARYPWQDPDPKIGIFSTIFSWCLFSVKSLDPEEVAKICNHLRLDLDEEPINVSTDALQNGVAVHELRSAVKEALENRAIVLPLYF
ncbi:AP-1 complex subunit gamma-1 [Striga asiatica]|uniref:AP-1 complex subunit gamma-1 n=1 Tax=Striga asiatica TaxID=4170 RepID=A0A5A7P869_STRAF|nr:AP-1 complex subunit gamma-1 [Striga asiatica]